MSRLRVLDGRVNISGQYVASSYNKATCADSALWSVQGSGTAIDRTGVYRHMYDEVTPNFAKLRGSGQVIMSPMSSARVTLGTPSGTAGQIRSAAAYCTPPFKQEFKIEYTNGVTFGGQTSGFNFQLAPDGSLILPSFLIAGSDIERAIREASTSTWNARGRADANLYETLAEAHKSHKLVSDILGNAMKVVSRKRDALMRAKDAGSAYLAYRYGLKPVMMDIEAVVKGLAKDVGTVRRTSRALVQLDQTSITTSDGTYGGMWNFTKNFSHTEVTKVRAMSLDESYVTLSQNIGFTDKGLATLPWELLPYSFVVDWFANVGDFLGALVPVPELRQLGTCFVVERRMNTSYYLSNILVILGWDPLIYPTGAHSREVVQKYRVPGIRSPSMVIKSDFRFDNLTRAADAAALIVQKLR